MCARTGPTRAVHDKEGSLDMHWIAAHVFGCADFDQLLVECVGPLVAGLRRRQEIQRFFFVRYPEGGPHVRLRFGGVERIIEDEVRPRVVRDVEEFVERHGLSGWRRNSRPHAQVRETSKCADASDGAAPHEDAIRFVPYEPEVMRYGGEEGIAIAEWHFDFSTTEALAILTQEVSCPEGSRDPNMTQRRRLGLAFQAHVVLPLALGYTLHQTGLIWAGCRTMLEGLLGQSERREEFERRFLEQSPRLCAMVEGPLRPQDGEVTPFVRRWRDHGGELATRLERVGLGVTGPTTDANQSALLVASYLHMFNNRLGLSRGTEMYLCHLASRTCQTVALRGR